MPHLQVVIDRTYDRQEVQDAVRHRFPNEPFIYVTVTTDAEPRCFREYASATIEYELDALLDLYRKERSATTLP